MGSRQPWDKFYWADWEADPGLRLCSLAAQGLWMRMLCIAAMSSDRRGYVCIGSQPVTNEQLARLVGERPEVVEKLVAELESAHVFARDRTRKIYCRRMIFAEKMHKTYARNGKLGGDATIRKQREKLRGLKQNEKSLPKPTRARVPDAEAEADIARKVRMNTESGTSTESDSDRTLPTSTIVREFSQNGEIRQTRSKRGNRLPEDWVPDTAGTSFARNLGFGDSEIQAMLDEFRDYWHAKAGQGATKVSWPATWRRWCRTQAQGGPGAKRPQKLKFDHL